MIVINLEELSRLLVCNFTQSGLDRTQLPLLLLTGISLEYLAVFIIVLMQNRKILYTICYQTIIVVGLMVGSVMAI